MKYYLVIVSLIVLFVHFANAQENMRPLNLKDSASKLDELRLAKASLKAEYADVQLNKKFIQPISSSDLYSNEGEGMISLNNINNFSSSKAHSNFKITQAKTNSKNLSNTKLPLKFSEQMSVEETNMSVEEKDKSLTKRDLFLTQHTFKQKK